MKKKKEKKVMKESKACWYEKVEYELQFICPHCKKELWDLDFSEEIENQEIGSKILTCGYCNKEFKLIIEE